MAKGVQCYTRKKKDGGSYVTCDGDSKPKKKMGNSWMEHVQKEKAKKANADKSYKEILKLASKTYKKRSDTKDAEQDLKRVKSTKKVPAKPRTDKYSSSKSAKTKKSGPEEKLVPGISGRLYPGQSLVEGARAQFEQKYGKMASPKKTTAKPLGKRKRKKPDRYG